MEVQQNIFMRFLSLHSTEHKIIDGIRHIPLENKCRAKTFILFEAKTKVKNKA